MTWYTGDPVYDTALTGAFVLVAFTVVGALFIATPYGRFADQRYGVSLDPRLGWFLMELPALVAFFYFFVRGSERGQPFAIFMRSLAGVYILAISMANLIPRAIATHRWYREKFADFPAERRVLIPGVW